MEITTAQKLVFNHLEKIGYLKSETTPTHAFLHLVEEVGEVSRVLLHKETKRGEFANTTTPNDLSDEVADIFWQTLKLASYLDINLDDAFQKKLIKNRNKSKKD